MYVVSEYYNVRCTPGCCSVDRDHAGATNAVRISGKFAKSDDQVIGRASGRDPLPMCVKSQRVNYEVGRIPGGQSKAEDWFVLSISNQPRGVFFCTGRIDAPLVVLYRVGTSVHFDIGPCWPDAYIGR